MHTPDDMNEFPQSEGRYVYDHFRKEHLTNFQCYKLCRFAVNTFRTENEIKKLPLHQAFECKTKDTQCWLQMGGHGGRLI